MAFRPQITRTLDRKGNQYAKGRFAVGICHRSGFKYLLKDLKFEPGTNFLVHESESDGNYSLVAHPQNFPPENKSERVALRWSSPETPLSVGVVVSADALFLPMFASVCNNYISYPSIAYASMGTGVSVSTGAGVSSGTYSLDFSQTKNSMYLIVVFPGI
jgi:hypothetical protein